VDGLERTWLYMVYVPFNGILFDRLLAALNERGNVGFLFYTADFCGYLGSVLVLLIKNFGKNPISWLDLLNAFAQLLPTLCIVLVYHLTFISIKFFNKNKIRLAFLGSLNLNPQQLIADFSILSTLNTLLTQTANIAHITPLKFNQA
jgi:hypothetical protein